MIGAALVLMIGGAMAYAAIPAADGTITGCVLKSSGVVRIIDTAKEKCKSNRADRPWNQAGQPGADGVSGYEIVTNEGPVLENSFVTRQVTCPRGKNVTGGGASIRSGGIVSSDWQVLQDSPLPDGSGWRATTSVGTSPLGDPITFIVYALCSTVTP